MLRGRQTVQVGQVWESTDARDERKQAVVIGVDGDGSDVNTRVLLSARRHSYIRVWSLWRRYRLVDGPGSDRSQS